MSLPPRSLALLLAATLAHAGEGAAEPAWAAAVRGLPAVAVAGAELRWGGDGGFALVGADARQVQVASPIGRLAVQRELLAEGGPARVDPDTLRALIAQAQAAGLGEAAGDSGLLCSYGALTGLRLQSASHLVLPEGALVREPAPAPATGAALDALRGAADDLGRRLPGDAPTPAVRDALAAALATLHRPSADADAEAGVQPALARQLVRHGWLARVAAGIDAAAVETAVRAATAPQVVESWRGSGGSVSRRSDAFGRTLWVLATPRRTAWLAPAPVPEYADPAPWREVQVLIEAKPGSDPLRVGEADLIAATCLRQGRVLARWRAGEALVADAAAWRAAIPAGEAPLVDGWLPPHLLVVDGWGDVLRLVTAHGSLRPPAGTTADAERFLAEAATALPDAAHLSLLGQHLFAYVHDSPDPRTPQVYGDRTRHGDLHQTSAQTLASAAGGTCRGDCDDLAELYHEIARRQGRGAHVIQVPGHVACAWAERADARWRVVVLHTGPTWAFAAGDLPQALTAAYRHFEPRSVFDPNQLSLTLRFAGENTRSSWRLGWRIFSEPDYARTMIDVQRDWHFRTYLRATHKMEQLIAGGDQDTANFSELAGLYRRTARWDEAIAWEERAIARQSAPAQRCSLRVQLVGMLTGAKRHDQALALARSIAGEELPAVAKALGRSLPQLALRLAHSLDERTQGREQLAIAARWVLPPLRQEHAKALAWIRNGFDPDTWEGHPELEAYRQLLGGVGALASDLVEHLGVAALAGDPAGREVLRLTQDWLDEVGFRGRDVAEPAYAFAGRWYELLLGRAALDALIAGAPPVRPGHDHAARTGGLAQAVHDAAWLEWSLPWRQYRLGRAVFGSEPDGPCDRAPLAAGVDALLASRTRAAELGLGSSRQDTALLLLRQQRALLLAERDGLRAVFAEVAARRDRRLSEASAEQCGRLARHLPLPWFAEVLAAWRQQVDEKPYYLAIAWTAFVAKADAHALAAARLAAGRFTDDAAFAEELAYLEKLVAERPASNQPATPSP